MSSTALVVALAFGFNFFMLVVALALFNHLGKEIGMFKDDVATALQANTDAITALKGRLPAPPDPATIVPVADQQAAVAGITASTAAINAIDPAVAPAP